MKKINVDARRNIKRNTTNDSSIIILNVSKLSLIMEKPNPINNGLNNGACNSRFFGGNCRPAGEKNKRWGRRKLLSKDPR